MNEQPERVADSAIIAEQTTHDANQSSQAAASWAEGSLEPGMAKPDMLTERTPHTPGRHLQAQALLPIARRIAIKLGHQERKLRDELTPTLNGLRQLAETTPPDTRAHQQTEFIIATIQHMFEDAKEAELRAGQIVADLENELAKGSDPLDQAGI